jgi:hypothetical protein
MTQYAKYETKRAALSGEFGQSLAHRWYGLSVDDLRAKFGTSSRGPRKGLPKGVMLWVKINEGGWVRGIGVMHPSCQLSALVSNEMEAEFDRMSSDQFIRAMDWRNRPASAVVESAPAPSPHHAPDTMTCTRDELSAYMVRNGAADVTDELWASLMVWRQNAPAHMQRATA